MPNADFQGLQAELDLLRQQVKSQLEAHRLEFAAALEQLAGAPGKPAVSGDELGDIQARIQEWERREVQLGERIAAKTVEYQALRAQAELDRYRQELRIADLEKQLALRDAEIGKLKAVLGGLMAEHAECSRKPASGPQEQADLQQLRTQLESSELECARLRHSIESSLALKLARSVPWLLRPLRARFAKPAEKSGAKS
jgi:chromosome segregation ATPase